MPRYFDRRAPTFSAVQNLVILRSSVRIAKLWLAVVDIPIGPMVGSERLAAQLAHLAQQAGAASASVYLPTPWNPSAPAVLVQAGEAPPLPELATAEAAEAFAVEVLETGQWNGQAVSADGLVASKSGDGVLIAAPLLTSLWAGVSAAAAAPGGLRRRSVDQRRMAPAAGWKPG